MNTREQFGNYLLLKKLSEDVLGETYRAGRVGKGSLESVVLLRVFNGQALDPAALWSKVSARAPLQQRLKSPNLGDGVDMAQVRDVPYVAYDYVSGKNLATLLEQAARKRSPIPTDHALLITERIALGLAVAYETRMGDQRLLHGFVVPHLVMLSNEGETRLLGVEVGPGLRDFAPKAAIATQLGRYLAPEALAGAPPHKSDDVYSLAAILLELLTSQPTPTENAAAIVDRVELANDGTPIPTELATLLKRSLAPRAERVGDVVTWHKMLSKLMFDGQYNPTTFNLAFFMHNLFRDDIERESQEIEIEKTISIPAPVAAAPPPRPAPAPAAAAGGVAGGAVAARADEPLRSGGAVRDVSFNIEQYTGEKKGGGKGLIFGAIALLAALGIGGYFYFARGGKAAGKSAANVPAAAPAPAPVVPAGPTPEEIQAQIQTMVAEQMKSVEESVRAEQEKKLGELQKQLEDARKAERLAAQQAAAQAAAQRAAAANPPPAATEADEPEAPRTASTAPAEPVRPAPGATAPATTAPATGATLPAASTAQQPASTTPPIATPATTQPAASATLPQVQRGELVEAGAGVQKPVALDAPTPNYPPMAERMRREADVTVRVLVDENGRVVRAELRGRDPGMGFGDAAIEAAKRARFKPPTKHGIPVKMWTDLKFSFKR